VVVIGSGGMGVPLLRAMKLSIPVLVVRERDAYRAWGLGVALGLIQKAATFLVDRRGVVQWRRASYNPGAAVDKAALVARLRELAVDAST
jgi:hypothetical protein